MYVVFSVHFRESAEPIGTFRLLQGAGGALFIINLSVPTILVCIGGGCQQDESRNVQAKGG